MPTSQIQLLLTLRAIILECEWGMETSGLWGTHWGRDGEAGLWGWEQNAGESVSAAPCWGAGNKPAAVKCRGGNKADVLIWKGSSLKLTLPAWLSLVRPPPGRSVKGTHPPSGVQNHRLCMQGVSCRESRLDGVSSSDKMRKRERQRNYEKERGRVSFLGWM